MIKIGTTNWVRELKRKTEPQDPNFWAQFKPATQSEVKQIETRIQRPLDPEFCEFYRSIGYGAFPLGGEIDSPEVILMEFAAPIVFITGSMSPSDQWAPEKDQVELWLTRGKKNPNPREFTDEVLTLDGVKLYDLLQFGSDGCCCYHQLYVGPEPAPLRYCLLTDSQEMEDRAMTFSEGLDNIIGFYLDRDE